jgi:hypothetical protein
MSFPLACLSVSPSVLPFNAACVPLLSHAALLPPYSRRSKSLEALLPWLYLKGISMGDFSEALYTHRGPNAPGLSPATLSRLKQGWQEELT